MHLNGTEVDCTVCKTDLWLSAVVSRAAPPEAACPEHAASLPGAPAEKVGCPDGNTSHTSHACAFGAKLRAGDMHYQRVESLRLDLARLGCPCVCSRRTPKGWHALYSGTKLHKEGDQPSSEPAFSPARINNLTAL